MKGWIKFLKFTQDVGTFLIDIESCKEIIVLWRKKDSSFTCFKRNHTQSKKVQNFECLQEKKKIYLKNNNCVDACKKMYLKRKAVKKYNL